MNKELEEISKPLDSELTYRLGNKLYIGFNMELWDKLSNELNSKLNSKLNSELRNELLNELDINLDSELNNELWELRSEF